MCRKGHGIVDYLKKEKRSTPNFYSGYDLVLQLICAFIIYSKYENIQHISMYVVSSIIKHQKVPICVHITGHRTVALELYTLSKL